MDASPTQERGPSGLLSLLPGVGVELFSEQEMSSRLQKILLIGVFSPLLILRWFLHRLPGNRRNRRTSNIKGYRPPPLWLLRLIALPLTVLNPPRAVGLQNVDTEKGRRILFIGNQQLLGLDQLVLITLLYMKHGVFCRRLFDDMLRKLPFAGLLLEALGGVVGTRKNAEELMQDGQAIVFYPGGIAESFCAPPLTLKWGERLGWCHLAIKHEYTIVPFASVGLDDALWVLFRLPLQSLLQLMGQPRSSPLDLPILAPFNSLERQYFLFGEPVETTRYEGEFENIDFSQEVYHTVYDNVTKLIDDGKSMAAEDPERYVSGRVWVATKRMVHWVLSMVGISGGSVCKTNSGDAGSASESDPVKHD